MMLPKIKLCWNTKRLKADWRWGLIGVYDRPNAITRYRGLALSLKGALIWLSGLLVVAYFSAAALIYMWLGRNPYNCVTYVDLVLPTHWSNIKSLRGKALVAEGLHDIKLKHWGEGVLKLRSGISRYPQEIEGRLVLGQLFVAMKATRQAREIYNGGFAFSYPGRQYYKAAVSFLALSEDYDAMLGICDRSLALVEGKSEWAYEKTWLLQQKIAIFLAAGRNDDVLKLTDDPASRKISAMKESRVLALLNLHRTSEAVVFLEEWSAQATGAAVPQVLRLQIRAYRESGNFAEMDRVLEKFRSLSPADPNFYVYIIVQNAMASRKEEAGAWVERFLMRFGGSPEQLLLLAAPLAEISANELLDRLIGHARNLGFDLQPFRHYKVEALLSKELWLEAADVLAEFKAGITAHTDENEVLWHSLQVAQVQAVLDPAEGTQSNLVSLIRSRHFALTYYKNVIGRLRRADRKDTARQIVTFAQAVYPLNPVIETWRKELDAELAAAKAAIPPVVILSRPATNPEKIIRAVGSEVAKVEVSEAAFKKRLDELKKAGTYAEALQYIREVKRMRPIWLSALDVELALDEVSLNGRAHDVLGMRSAARQYLTGERLRSAGLIAVARDLHRDGFKEEAAALVQQILAKDPDYEAAQHILHDWNPPPAAAKP